MGKQQRRRRTNKKGNNYGSKKNHNSSAATITTAATTSSQPNNGLIEKIRHGDVKVRHGALTGLSSTIFSPESLSKSKHIKLELIQAMAERIMDDDVPCALCAVGCIANYILFQDTSTSSDKSKSAESAVIDEHRLEIILAPILITKINKACHQIKMIHDEMVKIASTTISTNIPEAASQQPKKKNNQSSNHKKDLSNHKKLDQMTRMIMDQFSLISLSLHAFCGLVEILSVNNSASSLLYHQREEFLSATMHSFIISTEMIQSLTIAATTSSSGNNGADNNANVENSITLVNKMLAKSENNTNVIADVAVYAARTIHSSSDDNLEFINALLSSSSGSSWEHIISSIPNTSLPTLSRLHCAGIVITARQLIVDSTASHNNASFKSSLDEIIITSIFSLLSQCTMYSSDISSALCKQIAVTFSQLQDERNDEEMENSIVKMVSKRKESARSIARRQKEMKEAAKEVKKPDMVQEDNSMQEGVSKERTEGDSNDDTITDNQAVEIEQKYEKAIQAWKNSCLPLKLSIEVIANLCADRTAQELNDDVDVMEDEMDWDSDQEEKLLNSVTNDMYNQKQEDFALFKTFVANGIPDRVLSVFGTILLSLIGSNNNDKIPKDAQEDLYEILMKCSVCLGNMICNLHDWKSDEKDISNVWKQFFMCLRASVEGEIKFSNMKLPCQGVAALLSTMVAFLRFRPSLGNIVNEEDLNLLLSYIGLEAPLKTRQSDCDSYDTEACSDIQKDSITLLGILTSEPHSDVVNERICLSLLNVLNRRNTISAPIMSEILNVLMDMYSADEGDPHNHESIFRKNNVLLAFQKSVPVLKHKIRETSNSSPTEVAYLKEIALNASRFIKYKKG